MTGLAPRRYHRAMPPRLAIAFGLALPLALSLAACATGRVRPSAAAARIGEPLSLELPDLAGKPRDLAGEAAGKVLVVDLWATWCEPCRDSMPILDALAKQRAGDGLAVVGVSVDEDGRQIVSFVRDAKIGFPIVWDKGAEITGRRFRLQRVPTRILVDRAGIIRGVHEGWRGDADREDLVRAVDELLAEPAR